MLPLIYIVSLITLILFRRDIQTVGMSIFMIDLIEICPNRLCIFLDFASPV